MCDRWEFEVGLDNVLVWNRGQAIILTNDDPVQRRIYAALGRNELISHLPRAFARTKVESFITRAVPGV